MRYYAGIGSRKIPPEVVTEMVHIAQDLADAGFILRSGGAVGADSAFETGCDIANGRKEIFLPWEGYNGNKSNLYPPCWSAEEMAEKFHPAWYHVRRKPGAAKLHARNSHIILGPKLDTPVDFIVCWTTTRGGTTQALRIAKYYKIPIYNIKNAQDRMCLIDKIQNIKSIPREFFML